MRSLILVDHNFQDEEFVYPYYRLQEFSTVVVASADGKDRLGKYGVPARVNSSFQEIDPQTIDVLIIPGGFECPDRLRINNECLTLVSQIFHQQSVVGAICHGPWVLISARLTSGYRMTSYKAVHIDLENSGALVQHDKNVVVDRHLVTAQHYKDNPAFMKEVANLAFLKQQK